MVHDCLDSEAASYNRFSKSSITRQRFVSRMDQLIAQDLQTRGPIATLLSIGCGTGFREHAIRVPSGHPFAVVGVDVSAAMCAEARRSGLEAMIRLARRQSGGRQFDAAVFLYSLGLAPTRAARLAELSKVASHLKAGAPFYVDVLNLDDRIEGAPTPAAFVETPGVEGVRARRHVYRRIGSKELAYFHYFQRRRLNGCSPRPDFA